MPEIILPEHVIEFGIIPFINTSKPAFTNLQLVQDDGIEVTGTEATQKWVIIDKFKDIEGGATKEEQEITYLADLLATTRDRIQTANKQACTTYILSKYPFEIQSSMNAGVYSVTAYEAYQAFLVTCIAEENRVFDLLESATTIILLEAVEVPTWPEV